MDLPLGVIAEALTRAHAEAIAYSGSNYPRNAKGLMRWMVTVGELRKELAMNGEFSAWRIEDTVGRPLLIHKHRNISLAVAAGNKYVGVEDEMPNFARPKGPTTQSALEQSSLISLSDHVIPTLKASWFLLYYSTADEVRCEVSLGVGTGEDEMQGLVSDWRERNIVSIEGFEHDPGFVDGGEDVLFDIS